MGIHTLFLPVTILFTYLFLQVENIFIYIYVYINLFLDIVMQSYILSKKLYETWKSVSKYVRYLSEAWYRCMFLPNVQKSYQFFMTCCGLYPFISVADLLMLDLSGIIVIIIILIHCEAQQIIILNYKFYLDKFWPSQLSASLAIIPLGDGGGLTNFMLKYPLYVNSTLTWCLCKNWVKILLRLTNSKFWLGIFGLQLLDTCPCNRFYYECPELDKERRKLKHIEKLHILAKTNGNITSHN